MAAIGAPMTAENNRGGSGKGYRPMRRGQKQGQGQQKRQPVYSKDARMRFKNSKDPVYVAFDYIDKQSIPQLAADCVQDLLFDVMHFFNNVTSIMK